MRVASILLVLALGACADASADARRAGQIRYEGRTLEEWWPLRRDANDATSGEARDAIRAIGAAGVPYLAEKAAGRDLGETIGGSVALEDLCPAALPAMEAARAKYPSAALDAAIKVVRASAADTAVVARCAPGAPAGRADSTR